MLRLHWRGGLITDCDVSLPRSRPATVRTDEDTIGLVRRLALHHDDATIAGILNKQERATARGLRFTQGLVGNLRRHWGIPCFQPPEHVPTGELLSIKQAAEAAGEQVTPGAPWRIRVNTALRRRLVEEAPAGYVVMQEATKQLGVTRQTVLHRVKRGELDAVLVCNGRRKGLRIKVLDEQPALFELAS